MKNKFNLKKMSSKEINKMLNNVIEEIKDKHILTFVKKIIDYKFGISTYPEFSE
ncbi:MAG: hypothetical protein HGGPFJEG_03041 [Ignavibacteria bacterium]|nr:hypothetical protein [Ignavibacteria bacterium]